MDTPMDTPMDAFGAALKDTPRDTPRDVPNDTPSDAPRTLPGMEHKKEIASLSSKSSEFDTAVAMCEPTHTCDLVARATGCSLFIREPSFLVEGNTM